MRWLSCKKWESMLIAGRSKPWVLMMSCTISAIACQPHTLCAATQPTVKSHGTGKYKKEKEEKKGGFVRVFQFCWRNCTVCVVHSGQNGLWPSGHRQMFSQQKWLTAQNGATCKRDLCMRRERVFFLKE